MIKPGQFYYAYYDDDLNGICMVIGVYKSDWCSRTIIPGQCDTVLLLQSETKTLREVDKKTFEQLLRPSSALFTPHHAMASDTCIL